MAAVEEIVLKVTTDVGDLETTIAHLEDLKKLTDAIKAGPTSPLAKPLKDIVGEAIEEHLTKTPDRPGVDVDRVVSHRLDTMLKTLDAVARKLAGATGLGATLLGAAAKKFARKGYKFGEISETIAHEADTSEMVLSVMQRMHLPANVTEEMFRKAIQTAAMDLPAALAGGITSTVLDKIALYMLGHKGTVPDLVQEGTLIRLLWDRFHEMLAGPGRREERKEATFTQALAGAGFSPKRQFTVYGQRGVPKEFESTIKALKMKKDEEEFVRDLFKEFGKDPKTVPAISEMFLAWLKIAPDVGKMELGEGGPIVDLKRMKDLLKGKRAHHKFIKAYTKARQALRYTDQHRFDIAWKDFRLEDLVGFEGEDTPEDIMDFILKKTGYEHAYGVGPAELLEGVGDTYRMAVTEMKVRLTAKELLAEARKRKDAGVRKLLITTETLGDDRAAIAAAVETMKDEGVDVSVVVGAEEVPTWLIDQFKTFMEHDDVRKIGYAMTGDILERVMGDIPGAESFQRIFPWLVSQVHRRGADEEFVREFLDGLIKKMKDGNLELTEYLEGWKAKLEDEGLDAETEDFGPGE